MPAVFVMYGDETSVTSGGAPTYAAISGAFSNVGVPITANDPNKYILWIGPGPRVTRIYDAVRGTITRAAQLVVVNWPPLSDADAGQLVADRLYTNLEDLQALQTWHPVEALPYNEALHGAREFWESGAAARTRTFETPPGPTDVFETPENPVGPDSAELRPRSSSDAALESLKTGAKVVLVAGLIAGVIYVGVQYAGARAVRSATHARSNPKRRRRRR